MTSHSSKMPQSANPQSRRRTRRAVRTHSVGAEQAQAQMLMDGGATLASRRRFWRSLLHRLRRKRLSQHLSELSTMILKRLTYFLYRHASSIWGASLASLVFLSDFGIVVLSGSLEEQHCSFRHQGTSRFRWQALSCSILCMLDAGEATL